jgi:hypothetical protein
VQRLIGLLLVTVTVAACSVEQTMQPMNDGKYHPTANGKAESEADACTALSAAIDMDRSNLSCVGTSPTCPSLVQAGSGQTCAQYDQGTIQGCVDYFAKATTCQDISTRIDDCVFVAISGSAGKGC